MRWSPGLSAQLLNFSIRVWLPSALKSIKLAILKIKLHVKLQFCLSTVFLKNVLHHSRFFKLHIEAKTAWVFAIIKRRIDIISLSSKLFYWFFHSLYPTILNVQQFQQNNLPNISDVSLEIWWDSSLGGI